MIPYGKQHITQEDIDSVVDTLKSDFLTQGSMVPKFEQCLIKYCGTQYAVASNSATSALHLACLALGLTRNDWLWTSPISFVASANCGLYCNANVDFIDIDPDTYNLSVDALELKLIAAKKLNRLPKIVIPVHLAGQSCDMQAIYQLSLEYGFKIIEDAAHAIGGQYQGKAIGNCEFSDITIFSFHPVKIITTGEGGMALTNNKALAQTMRRLRSHGVIKNPELFNQPADGPWYYEQVELGYNYRLTDIQAALGISQMQQLDLKISERHKIAHTYNEAFKHLPITIPFQHIDCHSSFHLYIICIKPEIHLDVFKCLRNQGIGVHLHYIPIYHHPVYSHLKIQKQDFPNAESYYQQAISLPIYAELSSDDQNFIISTLIKALNA